MCELLTFSFYIEKTTVAITKALSKLIGEQIHQNKARRV